MVTEEVTVPAKIFLGISMALTFTKVETPSVTYADDWVLKSSYRSVMTFAVSGSGPALNCAVLTCGSVAGSLHDLHGLDLLFVRHT